MSLSEVVESIVDENDIDLSTIFEDVRHFFEDLILEHGSERVKNTYYNISFEDDDDDEEGDFNFIQEQNEINETLLTEDWYSQIADLRLNLRDDEREKVKNKKLANDLTRDLINVSYEYNMKKNPKLFFFTEFRLEYEKHLNKNEYADIINELRTICNNKIMDKTKLETIQESINDSERDITILTIENILDFYKESRKCKSCGSSFNLRDNMYHRSCLKTYSRYGKKTDENTIHLDDEIMLEDGNAIRIPFMVFMFGTIKVPNVEDVKSITLRPSEKTKKIDILESEISVYIVDKM